MVRQQMSTADLAELSIALLGLVIDADVAFPFGELHRVGLPEAERVDRGSRPAPAGGAVTEPRGDGLAGDGELDGTTETASLVHLAHDSSCMVM
jgi:hypothetical protein